MTKRKFDATKTEKKRPRALGGPSNGPIDGISSFRKASWRLLDPDHRVQLETAFRDIEYSSEISQLSEDANGPEYLAARTKDTEKKCQSISTELSFFKAAMDAGGMKREDFIQITTGLQKSIDAGELELRVIKRQRNHILQDMEEMQSPVDKARRSWVNLILDRIQLAGEQLKKTKVEKIKPENSFRTETMRYYGTAKRVGEAWHHYCVVTGRWYEAIPGAKGQPFRGVKAAHIVPKVLQGSELDQLFGVGETDLSEARNSEY